MTLRFFALVLFTSFFYATSAQTSFQYHLLEKVNHVRDSLGISLVKLDAILNEAALG